MLEGDLNAIAALICPIVVRS